MVDNVDVALLDGSFYSADELPDRPVETIGHPLVVDTMNLLEGRVARGELEVHFTHLNHSNPLLDPESAPYAEVHDRGFAIARDGQFFDLGAAAVRRD